MAQWHGGYTCLSSEGMSGSILEQQSIQPPSWTLINSRHSTFFSFSSPFSMAKFGHRWISRFKEIPIALYSLTTVFEPTCIRPTHGQSRAIDSIHFRLLLGRILVDMLQRIQRSLYLSTTAVETTSIGPTHVDPKEVHSMYCLLLIGLVLPDLP